MTGPNAGSGNTSVLHIINTSNSSQQFYGTLYNDAGERLGEAETLLTSATIAPYGRATLSSEQISDLFGETWSNPAMLEVGGADSFSLMIRLESPSGLVSNTNCVTENVVHNLEGFDSANISLVRFINTGTGTISNITGTIYDESGSIIGSADQTLLESLGAKQQTFLNRNSLGDLFGVQWDGTASLYVTNKPDLKLILINFIVNQETFFNFSCFDGDDDLENPVADTVADTNQDITNSIFTNTSADCADYANTYVANVSDVFNSRDFQADVNLTNEGNSCSLAVDGIPNHDMNDRSTGFNTDPAEVERTFTIPRNPSVAGSSTALTQSRYDGLMLNGAVIDLLSAGCYSPNDSSADGDGNVASGCDTSDDWLVDPLGTTHKFGADTHNAHTQPDGTYHYHGNPNAMFDDNPGANGSPLIGWAADGFPIYGTYFLDSQTNSVRKAVSGYTLKSGSRGTQSDTNPGGNYDGIYVDDYEFTDAGDLDACNGMSVNGQYGYYVTDAYPWIIGCHSGTPDSSFDKGGGGGPGLD